MVLKLGFIMPFSEEDEVLIKNLYLLKGYVFFVSEIRKFFNQAG